MKEMKKLFFAAIFCAAHFSLFAEVTIVNPAPGSYANLQSLVLDAQDGEEIYYSFSGADPLSQGFAYDGPVVLDVTGNVELRVAAVDEMQNKTEKKVYFSVEPSESENEEKAAFFKSLETGPCFDLVAGNKINVPFSMEYSFFDGTAFERGREISISKKATMERFVPVNFRDGKKIWRYVLKLIPAEQGALSQADVPFRIEAWTKIIFTDPKKIFSLDGSWWQGGAKALFVDRDVQNVLLFQSADFSPDNPLSRSVLPAKPLLKTERLSDGSERIFIEAQSDLDKGKFMLSASKSARSRLLAEGLFSELVVDAFPGEKIEEQIPVDVYYENVFQGTLFADVRINRLTPNVPAIKATSSSPYSRDDVSVWASAPQALKLFFCVSNPVEVEPSFLAPDLPSLDYGQGEYSAYSGQKITLFGDTEKILAYKVSFYSEDESGLKSAVAEYSVAIDKYNYYVDSESQAEDPDGSPWAPFNDLSMLSKIARTRDFSRFYIKGSVPLGPGEASVASNIEFQGIGDARVLLSANSAIVMKNAGLFAQNIVFEKLPPLSPSKKLRGGAKALTNFFVLDHSAATFKNCEIVARFFGDGRAFNCASSSLKLEATGVASNAEGYSCAINATGRSKISAINSRILSVADTAVAFASTGGEWILDNNFAQVSGRMGRPAEFVDSSVSLVNNKFSSDIQSKTGSYKSVYAAGKTVFVEDKGNIYK